jgi:hypothetical protein
MEVYKILLQKNTFEGEMEARKSQEKPFIPDQIKDIHHIVIDMGPPTSP